MNNTYIAKRINRRESLEREREARENAYLRSLPGRIEPWFWVFVAAVLIVLLLVLRP